MELVSESQRKVGADELLLASGIFPLEVGVGVLKRQLEVGLAIGQVDIGLAKRQLEVGLARQLPWRAHHLTRLRQ